MSESITITRAEWNAFMKRFNYLEEYVKNSLRTSGKSRWMNPSEACAEIGCGAWKLKELRKEGKIEWRYSGKGRGVMILRKSVEEYNNASSTMLKAV